jgi:hypothetical protein
MRHHLSTEIRTRRVVYVIPHITPQHTKRTRIGAYHNAAVANPVSAGAQVPARRFLMADC